MISMFSSANARPNSGLGLEIGGTRCSYKKLNVELIVIADEADPAVAELNAALDRMEEGHTPFGGAVETIAFERPRPRKRSPSRICWPQVRRLEGAVRVAVGT
jgi:hypothetical protein